jgi:phosphoribosylglycinamide formyltransferase 2
MSSKTTDARTLLLLGAGELGKELALAAQRMGVRVVAVDRYDDAPAMQVAHAKEVVSMLDEAALEGVIRTHRPDFLVPEFKGIGTERLEALDRDGFVVVPTVEAARLTRDREGIRRLAAERLRIPTPAYAFADSEEELLAACDDLGYPCVVKPITSYAGRGHSVVLGPARVEQAWRYAQEADAVESERVIVEELVEFEAEITLLVVRERDGTTTFLEPIGHRQDRGGYQESWVPAEVPGPLLEKARSLARALTDHFGGAGVYGVEFFITGDDVLFSALSPGPHETGLVTLVSQEPSQFDLHLRAILELPIPVVQYRGPAASAVILSRGQGRVKGYSGLDRALLLETVQLRIFGKPTAHPLRRMGVTLALGETVDEARARALEAAGRVEIQLH